MPPEPTSQPKSFLTVAASADQMPSRSTISAGMPEPWMSSWRCLSDSCGWRLGASMATGGTSSQRRHAKAGGRAPRSLERGTLVVVGAASGLVVLAGDTQAASDPLDALRVGGHALLHVFGQHADQLERGL